MIMPPQDIHDLWMKLELEGASAAITSVDAQPSHCQGVVVFVTGQLQRRVRTSHAANVSLAACRANPYVAVKVLCLILSP